MDLLTSVVKVVLVSGVLFAVVIFIVPQIEKLTNGVKQDSTSETDERQIRLAANGQEGPPTCDNTTRTTELGNNDSSEERQEMNVQEDANSRQMSSGRISRRIVPSRMAPVQVVSSRMTSLQMRMSPLPTHLPPVEMVSPPMPPPMGMAPPPIAAAPMGMAPPPIAPAPMGMPPPMVLRRQFEW